MDNANYNFITSQIGTFNNTNNIANNVANINTPGYKEDKMVFEKYLTQDVNDKNTMPLDRATIVDIKPGSMKKTGRELDFAINGDAFFVVETPLGPRYTRSGNFTINSEYELTNPSGYRILGATGDPILFNQYDRIVMIDAEGIVYARNTAQDNFNERGKLAIVSIEDPRALRKAGDGLFIVEGNVEIAQANIETYSMMQGFIEESNVVPITSMTKLVELQHKSAEAVNLTQQMENVNINLYKTLSKVG
jgi:flagellar basal-body rod protein FlgF